MDLAGDACCIEAKVGEEQVHLTLLDEFVGYTERERIHLELFFTQNFAHCFTCTADDNAIFNGDHQFRFCSLADRFLVDRLHPAHIHHTR